MESIFIETKQLNQNGIFNVAPYSKLLVLNCSKIIRSDNELYGLYPVSFYLPKK